MLLVDKYYIPTHLQSVTKDIKHGQLMVWWVPQVPMKPFRVLVNDIWEAQLLLDVLAMYDMFQYDNRVKPDFCNAGGVVVWDENEEPDDEGEKWITWHDEATGMEFEEFCESLQIDPSI